MSIEKSCFTCKHGRGKYGGKYGGMGGITPRYDSDGTLHTVNDKEKTDSLNIKRECDECRRSEEK
jgi:hypothetical protein